ncbi:zinc-finger domain-containing protein [Pandoraea fibrosis]|uniref:Zinc-finger domain-containing protein n=1 Tax=Pandoraea fibrosis TaxID=1891094 RepID=A0A5E4Y590_9BURK|nr:zinc-finger domain-containing protein [Pandoraea fibrosis]
MQRVRWRCEPSAKGSGCFTIASFGGRAASGFMHGASPAIPKIPNTHHGPNPMSEVKQMPVVEVGAEDLPVHCPNPKMEAWSAHPRVFIDVTHGEAACPYCGTRYRVKAGVVLKGHH